MRIWRVAHTKPEYGSSVMQISPGYIHQSFQSRAHNLNPQTRSLQVQSALQKFYPASCSAVKSSVSFTKKGMSCSVKCISHAFSCCSSMVFRLQSHLSTASASYQLLESPLPSICCEFGQNDCSCIVLEHNGWAIKMVAGTQFLTIKNSSQRRLPFT